jgi:hypothetical protein
VFLPLTAALRGALRCSGLYAPRSAHARAFGQLLDLLLCQQPVFQVTSVLAAPIEKALVRAPSDFVLAHLIASDTSRIRTVFR